MSYIGPPLPLTFEQFVANGCRDPEFEAWKRSCQRYNLAALTIVVASVVAVLVILGIVMMEAL